jgi:hypothetical protein
MPSGQTGAGLPSEQLTRQLPTSSQVTVQLPWHVTSHAPMRRQATSELPPTVNAQLEASSQV